MVGLFIMLRINLTDLKHVVSSAFCKVHHQYSKPPRNLRNINSHQSPISSQAPREEYLPPAATPVLGYHRSSLCSSGEVRGGKEETPRRTAFCRHIRRTTKSLQTARKTQLYRKNWYTTICVSSRIKRIDISCNSVIASGHLQAKHPR